ncbi:SURF1 family protein [Cryobacterium sp. Hh11]|uniref:SURF1 family cytochrome oxidase biogenesis protein n=1 Tax=Cryobacterium sp. Hh11 TaxID=2555868 RepID=UPI00106D871E|nr:SURF1 family protein [Cryobacterium sp. Hh11]TFD50415.1 SURF1 family protein [Cryobacterium sp. Hh11]
MIEGPATNTHRRTDLKPRQAGELTPPSARQGAPVAVYDTVTEGLTGWQFLRTWRWFEYIAAAIIFAIACGLLANWQLDVGQQKSARNDVIVANFSATPVPIEEALPTLRFYDANQNWRRVTITGVYRPDDELMVRNRSNSGNNGFEILTPLQLSDGSSFMVDRGWVAPSPDDALAPDSIPQAASGTVKVVVWLRPSEAPRGTGTPAGNQIQSITLSAVQTKIVGDLYTGAYGVLERQSPSAEAGLAPIQTTIPTEDIGTNYSYTLQWLLFALMGFIGLGLGMRREYRRLNVDDPEEQARASERLRKRVSKPFTDEELEDELLDGYISFTRWGISGGTVPRSAPVPRAVSSGTQDALGNEKARRDKQPSVPPTVYTIHAGHEPGDNDP